MNGLGVIDDREHHTSSVTWGASGRNSPKGSFHADLVGAAIQSSVSFCTLLGACRERY